MLRELKRGGQVYFLHNEVETIENRRQMLETLVPEGRIAVAHGQMHERELERVMRDFVAQRANVLLCTTIIETGIDVPSANTILIHRADKFGLAQLHQLRGRVGRSHHQAYSYLLVHDPQGLTKQAQRRLEAIQQMEELGSGFYLAMHDLEIRGTGEVLGDKQSGEIHEIGFQLYTDMLNDAVKALKEGKEPDLTAPLAATTEINLHAPAILPADYCGDVQERLSLYKRLANCEHNDSIDGIQEELIDRFGKLPPQAHALVETHRLRLAAKPLGISKIDAGEAVIGLQFIPNPPIDAMRIIEMVQKHKHIKLAGQDKLRIETRSPDLAVRVATVKETLRALGALSPSVTRVRVALENRGTSCVFFVHAAVRQCATAAYERVFFGYHRKTQMPESCSCLTSLNQRSPRSRHNRPPPRRLPLPSRCLGSRASCRWTQSAAIRISA
jgi:transcription-repair coupling factor (superfamily II helicase)